jgi:dienelactone hydrolase
MVIESSRALARSASSACLAFVILGFRFAHPRLYASSRSEGFGKANGTTLKSTKLQLLFLLCAMLPTVAQLPKQRFKDLVRQFDYDKKASLDVTELGREDRDGVTVVDLTYASPRGGRVPAYLVLPAGKGPFAAVLFGHWMMPGSPLKHRGQFLDEAVLLAHAGAASLLIDAPYVRPGFVLEKDEMRQAVQSSEVSRQQVIDFRRGLDLLTARPDVDARRVAYVGHSFDAHVGGILAGVEKRIGSFVLMAGGFADQEYVFDSKNAEMQKLRERVGEATLHDYFRKYAWDDPVNFVGHSAPAAVFLQFGTQDKGISEQMARRYHELFANPKRVTFYEAGHALNAAARKDRVAWLVERLALKPVDQAALARIPELK